MKVLDLCCDGGHVFEGWFGSETDFRLQLEQGLIGCPQCGRTQVRRLPSAPRLNLGGVRAVDGHRPAAAVQPAVPTEGQRDVTSSPQPTADEAARDLGRFFLAAVRQVLKQTEDVGGRFADEARRIHAGEAPLRPIRGQASEAEREALSDEGIEVLTLPVPPGLDGPLH